MYIPCSAIPDEDEPTDDGSIKPSELLATVPNFSIKHDTIENFKKNYQNLINGELIWIRNGENINVGDPGLYMYAANKLYLGFIDRSDFPHFGTLGGIAGHFQQQQFPLQALIRGQFKYLAGHFQPLGL